MSNYDDQNPKNVLKNTTDTLKNIFQTGTHYVQKAVENTANTTQDATQNLVNNVMNKEDDEEIKK